MSGSENQGMTRREMAPSAQYEPYIPERGPLSEIAKLAMVAIPDEARLGAVIVGVSHLLQQPEVQNSMIIEDENGAGSIMVNPYHTTAIVRDTGDFIAPTPDFLSMILTWQQPQEHHNDAA